MLGTRDVDHTMLGTRDVDHHCNNTWHNTILGTQVTVVDDTTLGTHNDKQEGRG